VSGIGVVTNPHAGANRKVGRAREKSLAGAVGAAGFVREPATLDELDSVARELYERRVAVVAVCGGDGSYFRTLTAIGNVYGSEPLPALLPLRGGSMNTIARAVGHRRGTPEEVLAAVAARMESGAELELLQRQLIRINGESLGFLVGCGAVVRFLQSYYARPGRGPVAAARVTAAAVVSAVTGIGMTRSWFASFAAEAKCDGERLKFAEYNALFAASIPEFGLGFRVAYLADRKPGYFQVLAGRPTAGELARRLPHMKRGWPMRLDSLYDNIARDVAVEFREPTPYMIDGDVLEPVRSLSLTAGPQIDIVAA